MRTYGEIQDLDSRVSSPRLMSRHSVTQRLTFRHHQLNTLIPLRSSTSCPLPPLPATYTKKRTSNVLATISRTLSPRRSPSSQANPEKSEKKLAPPILDLQGVAAYLTELSEDSLVRENGVFRNFFRARKDDLESSRVEKRMLRRAQSDLTTHLTVPSSGQGRIGGGILKSTLLSASTPARTREPSENSTIARNAQLLDSDTEAAVHLSFFPPDSTAASINEEAEPVPESSIQEKIEERRIPSSSTDLSMISATTSGSNLEVPSPSNSRIRVRDSVNSTSSDVFMEGDSRSPSRRAQTVMSIDQFECLRVLGKGCAGKVCESQVSRYQCTDHPSSRCCLFGNEVPAIYSLSRLFTKIMYVAFHFSLAEPILTLYLSGSCSSRALTHVNRAGCTPALFSLALPESLHRQNALFIS